MSLRNMILKELLSAQEILRKKLENLRKAGYEVKSLDDQNCKDLNQGFLHKAKFNKPFVRAKMLCPATTNQSS